MADRNKLDDAATRAMLSAGRDAAKRAAFDLLATDEERKERAATEEQEARQAKKKRTKLIVFGVLGLFILIGVVGLLLTYWYWFLALGVIGFAGWYGLRRFRKARALDKETEAVRIDTSRIEEDAAAEPSSELSEEEERARDRHARAEARATLEQEADEELAALKARMSK